VDGIAPAGEWATWWRAQAQAKRDGAPWSAPATTPDTTTTA
jgi:phthalate 4,5-dioxygenase